jgi:hypothetical protein
MNGGWTLQTADWSLQTRAKRAWSFGISLLIGHWGLGIGHSLQIGAEFVLRFLGER